ncbi:MAG: hypothetical protein WCF78_04920 [archaeon]
MMYRPEKSVSALIATILLVVVAVGLVAILFTWGTSFTRSVSVADNIVTNSKESSIYIPVKEIFPASNKIILENTDNTKDLNIVGYKVTSAENYSFLNTYTSLSPSITISANDLNSITLNCLPSGKFTLQLFTDESEYIDVIVSAPYNPSSCLDYNTSLTPTLSPEVSLGDEFSCALLGDGTMKCWGNNDYGQLGDGTTDDSLAPVTVSGITSPSQISAGSFTTCALLSDDTIKCWGSNPLGDGTYNDSSTPIAVSGITTATQIDRGTYGNTCAVLEDGVAKCWGYANTGNPMDGFSRLGNGTTSNQSSPASVTGITTSTQVSSGMHHACALLADSTMKCWGANYFGALGNGTTTGTTSPVSVTGITTATQVSAGANFSCALLADGTVKCSGANFNGQLGDGTTTSSTTFISVLGISTATQISSGGAHSCALLANSTIKCWGTNDHGQLGDGTTDNSSTPVTVSGITTATQIDLGEGHSCAVLADDTIKCWGYNSYGQLGDGTTDNSSTPVTVSFN